MNRERLMADAKRAVRWSGVRDGLSAGRSRESIARWRRERRSGTRSWRPPGVAGRANLGSRCAHRPDASASFWLAKSLPHRTHARSARRTCSIWSARRFSSSYGERKTLERIQHTLKTGKTLRN